VALGKVLLLVEGTGCAAGLLMPCGASVWEDFLILAEEEKSG
jgi:hypothetical protein